MQVSYCISIHVAVEIFPRIVDDEAVAVVKIEHRGHAIKAETIEAELLQPIAHIGEQELQRFLLAVVEEFGIPKVVVAACARMEILAIRAIEQIDALADVFHRVGMNQVHDDQQAYTMRSINKFLQLLRRTEP